MSAASKSFAVLAVLAAAGPAAVADDFTLPFQVRDHRQASQLVSDFERWAKGGDWTNAVDKLQQLLDLPADEAVVIRAAGFRPARFEGAGVVARRLFDGLPAEGRAAWDAYSRGRAELLLERGVRLRREQDLHDAARRYPASDVRRRAHEALAQFALVRADVAAAQFELESLLDACEAADRPAVTARLAWVYAQAGERERLTRLKAASESIRDAEVPSGAGTSPLGDFLERMSRVVLGATPSAPRQFGGDAHGSGVADAPSQPDACQWEADTGFRQGTENGAEDYSQPMSYEYPGMRPVVPLVAHGLVFVNNGLSLTALQLSRGTTAWRAAAAEQVPEWRDNVVSTQTAAVADGVVYAALVDRIERGDQGFDRTFFGHVIIHALPRRCLHAFDERTGEPLWSHDPSRLAGRDDAAEMAKESVASPPLVVGDDVIVATWTYEGIYDVRLVCFDRRTGETRWRTSLVNGQQELNLFGRAVKELATSALAEQGGRVFFSTGLGLAAAVERDDGRIAWLSAYEQTPIPRAMRWYETRDREVSWWPSPVSATPDGVVVAPLDGPELVCFDPADGRMKWHVAHRLPGQPGRWFLGAHGGRAFVVAGSRVTAFDVATGKPAWTDSDAGDLAPSTGTRAAANGAGLLTKDRIYVPTAVAIVSLSTATGAAAETWKLPASRRGGQPLTGDLVTGDGALLVVDSSSIAACYRADELRRRMEARLRQNPDDPQVRLEVGQAFEADGRHEQAIEALEGGLARLPQIAPRARDRVDSSLRRAIYDARLGRARMRRAANDVDGAAEDLRAAAAVSRDRGDAVRALLDLADAYKDAGRRADSEAVLRRVAAEFGDVVTTAPDGQRWPVGALASVLLGESSLAAGDSAGAVAIWLDLLERRGSDSFGAGTVTTEIRDRLAKLAETEPALVATAVHARAKRALDAAKAAADVAAIDRVARIYPDAATETEASLIAADMHIAAGRPRDAVGILSSLLATPRPAAAAARARWRLALAYRALGEPARERSALRLLAQDTPDEIVDGAVTAADAVKRELASPRFAGTRTRLPDPRPPLSLLWQAGGGDQIPPQPLLPTGTPPAEFKGRIVLSRAGVVSLVEGSTGKVVWERLTRIEVRASAVMPDALIVAGGDNSSRERAVIVLALSAQDGRELWRRSIVGSYRSSETTLGVMYLLTEAAMPSGFRPTMSMTAIGLTTGEEVARREFAGLVRPPIMAAEDGVVVTEPARGHSSLVVLDGTTLAARGRVALSTVPSQRLVHPPASSVIVTVDRPGEIAAVDVTRGDAAWKPRTSLGEGRSVIALFGVPSGVIVLDDANAVRLLDADSGAEQWRTSLEPVGKLVYNGGAAADDLVVATLQTGEDPSSAAPSTSPVVALDASTGKQRWRASVPAADETHPEILQSVVAYEINERLDRGARSRVLLLDRASGEVLQEIEHPTIGKTYQRVVYGQDWIALSSANELAVYGRAADAK